MVKGFHQQSEIERFFHQSVQHRNAGAGIVLLESSGHSNDGEVGLQSGKMPDGVPSIFLFGVQVEEDKVDGLIKWLSLKFVKSFLLVPSWNHPEVFNRQSLANGLADH